MNPELVAFFITLLVGPLMFLILQNLEPLDKKLPRFPSGLIGWIGDLVFLPFFNAFAVYYGILSEFGQRFTLYILFFSLVVFLGYLKYKRNLSNFNHWLRPKKGQLSMVGWYHSFYFFAQFFFVAASLFYLNEKLLLWVLFGGYIFTLIHAKKKYGL